MIFKNKEDVFTLTLLIIFIIKAKDIFLSSFFWPQKSTQKQPIHLKLSHFKQSLKKKSKAAPGHFILFWSGQKNTIDKLKDMAWSFVTFSVCAPAVIKKKCVCVCACVQRWYVGGEFRKRSGQLRTLSKPASFVISRSLTSAHGEIPSTDHQTKAQGHSNLVDP